MHYKHLIILILFLLTSGKAFSDPIYSEQHTQIQRKFEQITLSDKQSKALLQRLQPSSSGTLQPMSLAVLPALPPSISLGMNHVPVLDQGRNGVCSVFAVTAAIDAAVYQSDYISQLCELQLATGIWHITPYFFIPFSEFIPSTLEGNPWDGLYLTTTLRLIIQYGVLSNDYQKTNSCAGMTEYPYLEVDSVIKEKSISTVDFYAHSDKKPMNITWNNLLDITSYSVGHDALQDVKQALANGHRVIIGLMTGEEYNGIEGTYQQPYDSWVLSQTIKNKMVSYLKIMTATHHFSGHAVIITGYDDNAIIYDANSQPHQGAFTLRNSWGSYAGNRGDFYMSYDYFSALVTDAIEIIPSNSY